VTLEGRRGGGKDVKRKRTCLRNAVEKAQPRRNGPSNLQGGGLGGVFLRPGRGEEKNETAANSFQGKEKKRGTGLRSEAAESRSEGKKHQGRRNLGERSFPRLSTNSEGISKRVLVRKVEERRIEIPGWPKTNDHNLFKQREEIWNLAW